MPKSPEQIVVLHGIFRTHRSMNRIASALKNAGYTVFNVGYPSTRYPLEELVGIVQKKLITRGYDEHITTHYVGYSMGGLIVRALLTNHRPTHLGNVVMLGTPNQGSEAADWWKKWRIYRWLYGQSGQQLGTDTHAFWRSLPPYADYPLGIIAGNQCHDPICRRIMPTPNDGKVSIASSKMNGMKEHCVLPVTHTMMIHNRKVTTNTVHFIQHQCFIKESQIQLNT